MGIPIGDDSEPLRLKLWQKTYLLALLALANVALATTVTNRNIWPFASFNVFSSASDRDVWVLKAILVDEKGMAHAVDPGQVLPLEFFKARAVLGEVFLGNTSSSAKDAFAKRLIDRINTAPWHGFDEVLAAAPVRPVRSIRIELWQLDTHIRDSETGFALRQRLLAYSNEPLVQ